MVTEQPSRRRTATAMSGRSLEQRRRPELNERAERWQDRLAIPVLIAAMVSVPAIFMMMTGGATELVGRILNWLSVAVLIGESLVLLLLSKDVADWLRVHKWELLLAVATVPVVVFAIGPVQILRFVLSVGTLRVLRVRRILNAGAVVARKLGLGAKRRRYAIGGAALVAAAFLTIVLVNPESKTRRVLAWIVAHIGLPLTIICGIALAGALLFGIRWLSHTRLVRKARDILRPGRRKGRRARAQEQAQEQANVTSES